MDDNSRVEKPNFTHTSLCAFQTNPSFPHDKNENLHSHAIMQSFPTNNTKIDTHRKSAKKR